MFKEVEAKTVKQYLDSLPDDRKKIIKELDAIIKKAAPKLKPHFSANMMAYGSFKYTNAKKELLEWPVIGIANRKANISVYVCALEGKEYVAEKHKKDLGNVQVGKSCINIKRIEDLDVAGFKKVLKLAEKNPGLEALYSKK